MQPQRWEQFVNKDHHTDARVSLGNERGEGEWEGASAGGQISCTFQGLRCGRRGQGLLISRSLSEARFCLWSTLGCPLAPDVPHSPTAQVTWLWPGCATFAGKRRGVATKLIWGSHCLPDGFVTTDTKGDPWPITRNPTLHLTPTSHVNSEFRPQHDLYNVFWFRLSAMTLTLPCDPNGTPWSFTNMTSKTWEKGSLQCACQHGRKKAENI